MTARRIASVNLVAALLIVTGLALSTPPVFETASDDHFGQLLHPLFWHVHGGAHHSADQNADADDEAAGESIEVSNLEQSPSLRGESPEDSARLAMGGMLLPTCLAVAWLHVTRLGWEEAELPWQGRLAPPTPPPRIGAATSASWMMPCGS